MIRKRKSDPLPGHGGGEGGGDIGILGPGLQVQILEGLPDHGAQDGLWRPQDTLKPGSVSQIDPAFPVGFPVDKFHDGMIRNGHQIDLIPGEKIQLLVEPGAGKGQKSHVQKALQDHFLQIHAVLFRDLHMDPGILVPEPL